MIFLENKTDSISYFFEWELFVGLLIDFTIGFAVFMTEIQTDVFCIFDESLLLLDEEICILSHAFISFLNLASLGTIDMALSNEIGVFEMLIGFFEVEKLALNVEGSHLDISERYYLNLNQI